MITVLKRNILVYIRNRAAVMFSLLSTLIMLGIYFLFLGNTMLDSLGEFPKAKIMADYWLLAGVLATTSLTTALTVLGIKVYDEDKKIVKDLYSAPIRRRDLVGGYMLTGEVVGLILTIITFVFVEGIIVLRGGKIMDLETVINIMGVSTLVTLHNAAVAYLMIIFVKTPNVFSVVSSMVGTFIGFLAGVYIPVGILPNWIQEIVKILPVSHAAKVMREILINPISEGAPQQMIESMNHKIGISFNMFGHNVTTNQSIAYIAISTIVIFAVSVFLVTKQKRG